MGQIRFPQNVCLIVALCYNDEKPKHKTLEELVGLYGPIEHQSVELDFQFTSYYETEMGSHLHKQFYSFLKFVDPAILPDVKILTNNIEEKWSEKGKRTVNIDPGYVEPAKLILATTKNFSHRIYIGKGIYGDVQLCWKNGKFLSNPWTYPDYKVPEVQSFLQGIRNDYFNKLKRNQK
jgi:hypothetical protein